MSTPSDPGQQAGARAPARADGDGGRAGGGVQRVLGGRYRLERIVGKGAMGRVWAAHDLVLNRAVAIKEVDFPPGMPVSEVDQIAQRTIREARAVASVSDPHVVTIFDMLELPNGPAIVMELLSARSLAEIIGIEGPMTDSAAATIGLSVATGLLAAHSAGITHRDVKPGNVLICDDGRIKLTDFGIARSAGEQTITATGLLLGSPAYISPEVASGRPANAKSDAWGLGAMLFACVQGVPPFDRGTPMATLTAVVQDEVPPYPDAGRLGGVIRGLLVKDPTSRMSVGLAHQVMLRIAADSPQLVTHTWKPSNRPARPGQYQPDPPDGKGMSAVRGPIAAERSGAQARVVVTGPVAAPVEESGRDVVPADEAGVRSEATAAQGQPGRMAVEVGPTRTPPWTGTVRRASSSAADIPATLPPPPWASSAATSLRPLPAQAPGRNPRRQAALRALVILVAILAAALGYFGVRIIAHLENGVPIAASAASVAVHAPRTAISAESEQPRHQHQTSLGS